MKTGEKFYFVSDCGNGFEKGDVIEKKNSLTFGLLEEDSIFMLYGTLFTPAKRKLKNDNIVSIQTTMPTVETHQSIQIQKKIIRKKIKNRQSIEMKLKKKFPEKELEEKTLDLMSNGDIEKQEKL